MIIKNNLQSYKEIKQIIIFVFLSVVVFLVIKELFFSPKPPPRPFIIKSEKADDIKKGINWYLKNSLGSVNIQKNTCIIDKGEPKLRCGENLDPIDNKYFDPKKLDSLNNTSKIDKSYWYSIWKEKVYDSELMTQFAIYDLEVESISKISKVPSALGTELKVDCTLKNLGFSKAFSLIFSEDTIKNPSQFETEYTKGILGTEKTVSIILLKNPYGYYLPIYPLP